MLLIVRFMKHARVYEERLMTELNDAFEKWLIDPKIPWPSPGRTLLRISHQGGVRGLESCQDLTIDQCCLAVPIDDLRLILTPTRCTILLNMCGCFHDVNGKQFHLDSIACLVLFLHHLRKPVRAQCPLQSIWSAYLAILPQAFTDPVYVGHLYPKLKDFYLATESEDICLAAMLAKKRMERCFTQLAPLIDPHSPRELFVWAWFAVNSRCVNCELPAVTERMLIRQCAQLLMLSTEQLHGFKQVIRSRPLGEKSAHISMIPFFDLFNHSSVGETIFRVDLKTRSVRLCSRNPVGIGQPVTINYGPHDNLTLFVEYGFILDGEPNPHDAVYPSQRDLLQIMTANGHSSPHSEQALRLATQHLGLTPFPSIKLPHVWPTVCFTHTGPSYHLTLLFYCINALRQLDTNDFPARFESVLAGLFELGEEALDLVDGRFCHELASRLLEQTSIDSTCTERLGEENPDALFTEHCSQLSRLFETRRKLLYAVINR